MSEDLDTSKALAKIILKLFEPTAEYLGKDVFLPITRTGIEKIVALASRAKQKLGPRAGEPGACPPRLLRIVYEEVPFVDKSIVAEYYAGMLAASRTKDDLGETLIPSANLISRLSSFSLRLHYVLYKALYLRLREHELTLTAENWGVFFFISEGDLYRNMALVDKEHEPLLHTCLIDLLREDLIQLGSLGPPKFIEKQSGIKVTAGGLVFSPTVAGLYLLIHAYGHFMKDYLEFSVLDLDTESLFQVDLSSDSDFQNIPGAPFPQPRSAK